MLRSAGELYVFRVRSRRLTCAGKSVNSDDAAVTYRLCRYAARRLALVVITKSTHIPGKTRCLRVPVNRHAKVGTSGAQVL